MRRFARLIPALLGLAGLSCLTIAAFLVAIPLGLAAAGVSLILVAITLSGAQARGESA